MTRSAWLHVELALVMVSLAPLAIFEMSAFTQIGDYPGMACLATVYVLLAWSFSRALHWIRMERIKVRARRQLAEVAATLPWPAQGRTRMPVYGLMYNRE